MKSLVANVILVSALSFWGGADVARAAQELSCGTRSCSYTEEIGPVGSKTYHGHCYGIGNTPFLQSNSSMVCHAVKGVTCSPASWDNGVQSDPYWNCECTNWNATHEAHPTFDITCPAPS